VDPRACRSQDTLGELGLPVVVGGATIRPGDVLLLCADGVAVVEDERKAEALQGLARPRGKGAREARAARGR
jgi:regulator of RNase E activity RraA